MENFIIRKKDGTLEDFKPEKIKIAVNKSAARVLVTFSDEDLDDIVKTVLDNIHAKGLKEVSIYEMHNLVEESLEKHSPQVAKSYRDYRNYKVDFVHMLDNVYTKSQSIMYIGDKENSNSDSALVSTKRSLIYNELNKNLYKKFFLNVEELQAINDGYIYIHDMNARRDCINCSLFDIESLLKGGFEMGNLWYNEPKTLDVAFDVIGDVVLSASAQQYGGFSLVELDKVLAPYGEKSYKIYFDKYKSLGLDDELASKTAMEDVEKDYMQGFQGLEYKFNTVGSSRGDYPFITVTLGLGTNKFEKMATKACLRTRCKGQGRPGFKRPVLFPKIVFLYDKELHGKGKINEDLFEEGVICSSKTMYPDWLSLSGEGYVPSMYKKYGKVVSPMGCRAFLSPWYERGGMYPEDEKDEPVFVGRFNLGAISLHLPMILAKARKESKDFYEVLDYYLNLIRKIHIKTYDYLGEMKASTNPLGFCQGGFYGGHLKPSDKIKSILRPMTMSFGFTALNELQELYNGKSISEDGDFALEVMKHINKKVDEFKKEDNILYAIYGTPAESLCFTGDTVVQTYNGNKMIKDLTTNDLVYSLNEKENKIELKKVLFSGKTKENAKLVKVTFDNGESVRCTPEHLFGALNNNGSIEYVMANSLTPGALVKSRAKVSHKVLKVENLDEREDVYDITVEDNHNFYVGGNDGILVHNCGTQVKQFRKLYGIIENVSDRPYVSNSFHCHVSEELTPIEKQNKEKRFWDLANGGKIQYVKYPIDYNLEALRTLIRRAMDFGYYEGVNLSLAYCEDCGHQELNMDVCPKCGSRNLTKIERMNGYLSYSRVHGDTRLNEAKMAEISERKSM